MRNFFYKQPEENVHSIEILYPNQTRQNLESFLSEILDKKEINKILNDIILGETAYASGKLVIIKRQNTIVNIKDSRNYLYIKKRVMSRNDYIEYLFKYDYNVEKYQLKIMISKNGKKIDMTDAFDESEEILKLLEETNVLYIVPDVNICNDKICIINGQQGILETSNDEISLYSFRQFDTPLNEIDFQRYIIIKNDTKEVVGNISFAFSITNISYEIHKPFRGNHYASKALKLMVELIKDNVNFQKRNLYIRIDKNNLASIKTAEACNFSLVDDFYSIREYVVNPQKILTVK